MTDLYQNQTQLLSYELFLNNLDGTTTEPTIASGFFSLINASGTIVVPPTAVSISSNNVAEFLAKPSSGTALIGVYHEVWDLFVSNESFINTRILRIKELR